MNREYEDADAKEQGEDYMKSAVRIANFIDNFTDFMYYNLQEAINNPPKGMDESDTVAFLTSLRKEVADFQARVESLRGRFQV